eukprot:TRINITY_DN7541_c0_g2_i1.p1 TRINITY_DN7541_c0_g2~~TRINITY_DN7541_c0_g2_i1.p1  ORF type:complete len:140 (-),score=39.78 TRINITY_DN7541_c0_g2_i1:219-638(-)
MWGGGEVNKSKATFSSLIAGIIFGMSWWVYLDGQLDCDEDNCAETYDWLPGVGTTLAFIIINGIHWPDLTDEEGSTQCKSRTLLMIAVIIALGSIAAALVIMVDVFDGEKWTGAALLIQNVGIFIATFIMRFGTMPVEE